jgi:hypothetical protein
MTSLPESHPMRPTRRTAAHLLQALALALMAQAPAGAQVSAEQVRLFRLVTMRGDVLVGLTDRELAALGVGADVERIARRIAQDGQFTAWRYSVTRAADGSTRFATRDKVAVLRQDALMVEPYAPSLPVLPPPAE